MKKNYVLIASAVGAFTVLVSALGSNINKIPGLAHVNPLIIQVILIVAGIIAGIVVAWMQSKQPLDDTSKGGGGGAGVAEGEVTDLDELLDEAEARLAAAEQQQDTNMGKLPAVIFLGESGSAKTTTMVQSGAEAESLAGQVYEENNILPTPTANVWFAHHTVFVEMAGKTLGDSNSWKRLIGHMAPGKIASLLGSAAEAPRAALVCVDAEALASPSPDALAVSARKLRGQLAEISQLLGISLPVYVLFTRSDRLPFFTEYVSKLNNEEATRILGCTLPIVETRQGIYAEQETNRLSAVFEHLFRKLCNARPTFLARENDPMALAAMYEFPREFRKVKMAMIRYLVELCRPSQITVGPFLRGFYFSGVRPIMVNEMAPAAPAAPQPSGGHVGLTGMFQASAARGAAAAAQRIVGQRKVPQWLFLSHFFNDLLLADTTAKTASSSSIRASVPRRILLLSACALCLIYSALLVVSFANNRALARDVQTASAGITAAEIPAGDAASLDSLRRLERLRQSLALLTKYNRQGAPWSYRWGLYIGNDLYPDVRTLYFADFKRLLLDPTQDAIVKSMRALPAAPGAEDDYSAPYNSLKAYLETTSNHDKTTRDFLPPVLLDRWSANRNVDPARMKLAQTQFEFYSDELKLANPFSSDNDAASIGNARHYLSQFGGFQRVYQAMLVDAAKTGPTLNFNKKFPGSADEVVDTYDVQAAFTKPGWDFMKGALKDPGKYFEGEPWVLGPQSSADIDRTKLAQQLASQYYSDYVKNWRAYMKAASIVRYAGLPDASKKLTAISGNQSPLLALFWLCSQNTGVDVPDVANAFQPVQTVVPSTNVDKYIAPSNQAYMTAMVTLQASVDTAAQQQPSVSDAASSATLTSATAAHVSAKQVAQLFRLDSDFHMDQLVQKLMEDPITYVESLLRNLGPEELNTKGRALCGTYHGVMNKFPFNPAATPQATVDDVNSIFKTPDGALWKFYNENLQKLLPKQGSQYVAQTVGGVTLNPLFVSYFNKVAGFSDALYTGGTPDPHFTYTLTPVVSEGIDGAVLNLDGQEVSYSGSSVAPKTLTWQPSGTHAVKATYNRGGSNEWDSEEGLWAIFKFFYQADHVTPAGNAYTLEWVMRTGKDQHAVKLESGKELTVRFQINMGNFPMVFSKNYFAQMGCVPEVAKQ